MRTTVTLDPDTERLLRNEVARRRLSFKKVLNDAVRKGLAERVPTEKSGPIRIPTFRSPYRSGIDRARLQQLADEMENEEFTESRQKAP